MSMVSVCGVARYVELPGKFTVRINQHSIHFLPFVTQDSSNKMFVLGNNSSSCIYIVGTEILGYTISRH